MVSEIFAAETLGGVLAAVSILWSLNVAVFWRAVGQPRSHFIGWMQLVLTGLAVSAIVASILALHELADENPGRWFEMLYSVAVFGALLFTAVVGLYYGLLAVAYLRRQSA